MASVKDLSIFYNYYIILMLYNYSYYIAFKIFIYITNKQIEKYWKKGETTLLCNVKQDKRSKKHVIQVTIISILFKISEKDYN